ncbi:lipoate--protein ligase family protein [Candidatus Solincola tengchongensis]|uniref:lipoate--protein ligase family protein n=1 Tax=Candidatus Solincola tengchongensis TaxID=2900693 RepID=UPI00257BA52E|nr:lipoate--protein ligase family protein [Candidatus Solincola tengchongensis]
MRFPGTACPSSGSASKPTAIREAAESALRRSERLETWRLLPHQADEGASHMALDQALLECAAEPSFPPTLRFQRWIPPALSLGRFQKLEEIDLEACAGSGVQVVRRPTGGKSILHLEDFTYSLVLPSYMSLPSGVVETYALIGRGIVAALRLLGLDPVIHVGGGAKRTPSSAACFASSTQADIRCGERKVCGSAQLRRGGAVLQHGSVLLKDRSEFHFRLLRFEGGTERSSSLLAYRRNCASLEELGVEVSWEEMAECLRRGFEESFDIRLREEPLREVEELRWRSLIPAYRSREWLHNPHRLELPPLAEEMVP